MFAHLHLHTEYSLLDGACRIGPLMDRLKELGMTHCAVTDHGVMYGVVEFYEKALEHGIHPVIGCEVYVCPDMDARSGRSSHLILLCENNTGYHNLCKLVSEGFTRGFYYRPRVDYALLEKYHEGLICCSACLSGDLPRLLLDGRNDEARAMAQRYIDIFGRGNFYIEIQDHGLADERRVMGALVRLARSMDIPLVATNDCHYLTPEDAEAQEVLMCIQTGKTLSDTQRMRMETDQLYVKSEEEMQKLFPQFPDALENTVKIAERCNVTFDFKTRHLPHYPLEEGQDALGLLTQLCEEGLARKYAPDRQDARDRLTYELGVISSMGFVDYFLIVWDYINFARRNGILVGPGRGSGAGSIVAYTLDITAIDPLKYQLVFERFLNPERVSMPDLDIDFDYERRPEVIEYVAKRYGRDHVSQIITFGTMAARAVLRDVGRVLGLGYQETDAVCKMVPAELNMTLDKAMNMNSDLKTAYESDENVKRLIDTAKKLEGMPRHASTHAAGVLITSHPVSDYVPLQTNDDVITTQFPMGTLEHMGLLKMDFLGLRTLNVIGDCLDMIREEGGPDMQPEDIPMDDDGVYRMISHGETDGVFQLESSGMRSFLTGMKPSCFEDIIAGISLYRPGPMDSIPRYVEGKHKPETVRYLTPELEPILGVTYGCMVYQEQVMQMVRDLAGYSMGRSDLVRRAMAKKKHDVMAKEKEYFIHGKLNDDGSIDVPGALRRGVSQAAAEQLFDEMTAFASYAFNKSHAAAYGMVTVQTAWLKLHYPEEFMAALMNSIIDNTGKVAYYVQYCRKNGIEVLPADVNRSSGRFRVDTAGDKKAIRFGMGAVKGVGDPAVRAIVREAEKRPFADIFDFTHRVAGEAVNRKAVESLIRAGALDTLPGTRSQKLAVHESLMDSENKRRRTVVEGQLSLFDAGGENTIEIENPRLPNLPEFDRRALLAMEKEVTGVYISGHPLDDFAAVLDGFRMTTRVLAEAEETPAEALHLDGQTVEMAGIITELKPKATKSGSMMAFAQLEDLYGSIEVLAFPRVYEKYRAQLVPDSIVAMRGKLSVREDKPVSLLADSVRILTKEVPAASTAQPAKKLYLRLTSRERMDTLSILKKTPGDIRVMLYMADEKKTYAAPQQYWVNERYDAAALTALLGGGSVVLK